MRLTLRTATTGLLAAAALLLVSLAAGQSGTLLTTAGTGAYGFSGDWAQAGAAQLDTVYALAADAQGNVYVADSWNHRVRRIASDGVISTVAGTGEEGFSGDGGAAGSARLLCPRGLAVDAQGNLYIADSMNHRVRKVTPADKMGTVAGTGAAGSVDRARCRCLRPWAGPPSPSERVRCP